MKHLMQSLRVLITSYIMTMSVFWFFKSLLLLEKNPEMSMVFAISAFVVFAAGLMTFRWHDVFPRLGFLIFMGIQMTGISMAIFGYDWHPPENPFHLALIGLGVSFVPFAYYELFRSHR